MSGGPQQSGGAFAARPVLSAQGLGKTFGAVVAAAAIGIDIAAGERVSLIGSNGAGKTTFADMITGCLKPDAGRIVLDGTTSRGSAWRARSGSRSSAAS